MPVQIRNDSDSARHLPEDQQGIDPSQSLEPPNLIPADAENITPHMLTLVNLRQEQIDEIVQMVPGGASNVQDIYPLSALQEGMLFHHLLNESNDTYVLSTLFALESRAHVEVLLEALQRVVDKHDILRTSMLWQRLPRPVQVVHRRATLLAEEIELAPKPYIPEQLKALMRPECVRLNLQQAPLVRLQIAADTNSGGWYAILRVHHVICDHQSLRTIVAEALSLIEGRELPVQFATYRSYVALALSGGATREAESFFRSKLGSITEPTAPFGLLDVHGDANGVEEAQATIEGELARQIRAQARAEGVSVARLFHAAWALVVAHTSARDDIVFGTVLLARQQRAVRAQRVLGMSVNTLPLRLQLSQISAKELVAQTHRALTELSAHERVPLTVAQSCSSIASRTPLFTALLNYRRSIPESGDGEGGNVGVRVLARGEAWSNYPISLTVDDFGDSFTLTSQVDHRIGPGRMLGYLVASVRSLADTLARAPQTAALTVSILPDSERHEVIEAFNANCSPCQNEQLIHQLYETQAACTPCATAIVYEDRSVTYAELNARADLIAEYLRARNVGPGRLVGICVERGIEMIAAVLGVLKAGGAYVPLDPSYPHAQLGYMLQDAAPTVVLTQTRLKEKLPETSAVVIALDTEWEQISAHHSRSEFPVTSNAARPHDLAYVIYTSGSTGRPKGTMVEHRNVVNLWRGLELLYAHVPACQRVALNASFNFDASVQQLVQLLSGRTLFVVPPETRRDTALFLSFMNRHGIEAMDCTPSQLRALIRAGLLEPEKTSLRLALVGGEAIDPQLWRSLAQCSRIAFFNVYGPTECTVDATVAHINGEDMRPHIGRPMQNRRIYILSEHGIPVPVGVSGEICIGGAGVGRGYRNQLELTTQRFVPDPFSAERHARMYRTGDLGCWRSDGTIQYLGRNDDQVKIRGFRIELGEIQAQLVRHSQVKEAAVVPRADVAAVHNLIAYLVVTEKSGQKPTVESLRAHASSVLPEHMVPSAFVLVDKLPLTASGKLDRRALPEPSIGAYTSRPYEAPQGEIEEAVAALWREVLGVECVGRTDSFFDLGGHSLLAMQLMARIQASLSIEIPIRTLFESSTLHELSLQIEKRRGALSATGPVYSQRIQAYPRDPRAGRNLLPVSWAQQRLWFIDQLEGGGAAYNVPMMLRLHGQLDVRALQDALDILLQRHEILRTTFVAVEGEPRQEITPESSLALQFFDFGGYSAIENAAQVRRHSAAEAHERFDLRCGPLIRARLLRLSTDEHILLVTMHHITSDGWSIGVLIRELAELYSARREGRAHRLQPLPIHYADYALWQRAGLQGEVFDRQVSYWHKRLEGATPEIELPTDRPRPAAQAYHGDNIRLELDAQLSAHLNALARRHGMTLFMVLYAGWSILLARLSGQEDVLVGTPVANRRVPEVEGLIGFFVNTLVLRVAVTAEMPLRQFLNEVKETTIGAFDHQDIPFEQLVELLRPERSLSRHPIFQVMLVLQNAPRGELQLAGLNGTVENVFNDTSKFDLLLSLEEHEVGIAGIVNYDTDLFDRATVQRWVACFAVLLEGMTQRDESLIGDLPIMPRNELRQVIDLFNATAVPYRPTLIHELFEVQAERTPEALALTYKGELLTYAELNCKANQRAALLRARGIGPDRLVGVCLERSPNLIIGLLAILKAGAAYLPLDPNYPAERLKYMLQDASPALVLTQESLRASLPATAADLIDLDMQDVGHESTANVPAADIGLTPEHLLYVIYTSGSTGRPKGTAMPHGAMANLIEWHRATFDRPAARVLQFAALSFDVAFQEIFSTLCTGCTLVLLDECVRRDATALVDLLRRQRVDRLFLPPIMLQSLADHFYATGSAPTGVREVITAGEQLRISPEVVDLFSHLQSCKLHNHYGPTETHVVTAVTLGDDPQKWPVLPTIGTPIANTHIYVLDRRLQPVPIGVMGEIYIGGANLARGYLNRPALTSERFVSDPIRAQGCVYKTGDLARWRADGTLEYLGRNDDQIKIRGFRIELGEIEAQIALHEQVKEAVVVARKDADGEQRLVAYITARESGSHQSAEELRAHLKHVLPEHMVPSAFVRLAQLPLTPSGKLNRRALPAPGADAYVVRQYEAPQGEIEEAIARILGELLGVQRVGRNDNFFDLGGHSLMVLKVLFRINQELGHSLKVSDVYKGPTIPELAARIQGEAIEDTWVDLSREATLSAAIVASPERPSVPPEAVIITGATGFVGRFLLAQLLWDTAATVYCLVRASSDREALVRVKNALSKWDLWSEEFAPRVIAISADLRMPSLGLDQLCYRMLAQRTDSIYHCGTSMNHLETYEMAKAANVDGVRALLALAAEHRPKVFNYISTLGVFSSATTASPRLVDERTSVDGEKHSTALGYVASKWVAEKLVMLADERNIPCNIFRVGLVWADARQGRYDELQRGYRVLKSALLCGYGIENYRFEMAPTPVDYVARAIVFLSRQHSDGRGIFHITSDRQPIDGLFERCNALMGMSLELLPMYDWVVEIKRLHLEGRSLPIVPLMAFAFSMSEQAFHAFQHSLGVGSIRFAYARTQRELERAKIMAPLLDDELLRTSINRMLDRDDELHHLAPCVADADPRARDNIGPTGHAERHAGLH